MNLMYMIHFSRRAIHRRVPCATTDSGLRYRSIAASLLMVMIGIVLVSNLKAKKNRLTSDRSDCCKSCFKITDIAFMMVFLVSVVSLVAWLVVGKYFQSFLNARTANYQIVRYGLCE